MSPWRQPDDRIDGTAIHRVSHIGGLQTIKDDNEEFVSPEQMIQRWIEDNGRIAEVQRAAAKVCDRNRDAPTDDLLQEILLRVRHAPLY